MIDTSVFHNAPADTGGSITLKHTEDVKARVDAFMNQNQPSAATTRAESTPVVPTAPQVQLPKDSLETPGGSQDEVMQDALSFTRVQVTITEEEEDLYLKAMLTDSPVVLTIKLFGGKLRLRFRSRTMLEQEQILHTVRQDIKEDLIDKNDAALTYTRIQQYSAALMLQKINDDVFSDVSLSEKKAVAENVAFLRALLKEKIVTLPQTKWLAISQALIVFETKCRLISEKCLNTDFSKPLE